MNLATYQRTLQSLFMTPAGKEALISEEHLAEFLTRQGLDSLDRQQLLDQGLPRLRQYDHMLLANVRENIEATCPHTHTILSDIWDPLMRDFFFAHPPTTYRLQSIAAEFPDFLDNHPQARAEYPFAAELALLEWVECELMVAPNMAYPESLQPMVPLTPADLHWMGPVLNSVGTLLACEYPLHAVLKAVENTEVAPSPEPQSTLFWVYRTERPYLCLYMPLDSVMAYWLRLVRCANMQGEPMSYAESIEHTLAWVQRIYPVWEKSDFETTFHKVITDLFAAGVLAGSYPVNPADQDNDAIAQLCQQLDAEPPCLLGERYSAVPDIVVNCSGQWQPKVEALETTRTRSRFTGSRLASTWFSHLYLVEPETHHHDLDDEGDAAGCQCGSPTQS